jgi:hypothetical protein
LWAIDCATGTPRSRILLPISNNRADPEMRPTPDRRFLLVHQASGRPFHEAWLDRIPWAKRWMPRNHDTLIGLETDACLERFRLHGWGLEGALLSDDGRAPPRAPLLTPPSWARRGAGQASGAAREWTESWRVLG